MFYKKISVCQEIMIQMDVSLWIMGMMHFACLTWTGRQVSAVDAVGDIAQWTRLKIAKFMPSHGMLKMNAIAIQGKLRRGTCVCKLSRAWAVPLERWNHLARGKRENILRFVCYITL